MEKAKLEEFNEWWVSGKVDEELALPYKRPVFFEVEKGISKRFILALVGLRRTGKTTLLYQIIHSLLNMKTEPENIVFFSFDENSIRLSEVVETYQEIQNKELRKERVYFFLDEIQKCENWENELKKYYDLYPKAKFIISGSESLFIKKKNKETLAGRLFEFFIRPFSFREYLEIKGVKEKELKYETRISPIFADFIKKGGFPETFSLESEKEFREYIRSLVVDKIVYKDIPALFRIEDPQFLAILLEIISSNPGMYLDYLSLSRQFGKDRRVIKDYIFYLKESFLIKLLGNYRKSSFSTLRKTKRAYPSDNALISLYKPSIDESFFGKMVENAIINEINADAFWKNHGEIDAVKDNLPIEVKYQEKINTEDFAVLREFMRKFNLSKGIMVTKKEEGERRFEEGKVEMIPAWKFLIQKR